MFCRSGFPIHRLYIFINEIFDVSLLEAVIGSPKTYHALIPCNNTREKLQLQECMMNFLEFQ